MNKALTSTHSNALVKVRVGISSPLENGKLVRLTRAYVVSCLQGHVHILFEGKEYHLGANSVCILFPGQSILQLSVDSDFLLDYVSVAHTMLSDVLVHVPPRFVFFLREHPFGELTDPFAIKASPVFFSDMNYFCSQTNFMGLNIILLNYLSNHFLLVYNIIYAELKHNRTPSRRNEIMGTFMSLLSKNYKLHRDVNFYADQICVTPKYLSVVVQENDGRSAKKCIDDYLVSEIKMALLNSSVDLKHLAANLNFSSQTFLSKFFRLRVGCTPSEWRRKVRTLNN